MIRLRSWYLFIFSSTIVVICLGGFNLLRVPITANGLDQTILEQSSHLQGAIGMVYYSGLGLIALRIKQQESTTGNIFGIGSFIFLVLSVLLFQAPKQFHWNDWTFICFAFNCFILFMSAIRFMAYKNTQLLIPANQDDPILDEPSI